MMHVTRFGGNATALPGVAPDDLLDAARALHLRRQLDRAAEHGAALLASLGLPRLVTPDFVPLDPAAIGEAVEAAVAALDEFDGDPEAEDGHDAEHDTADAEEDLGWTACVSQVRLGFNTADGDLTALERHGRGFIRSGPDDCEDDDPLEDDFRSRRHASIDRREAAHA